MARTSISHPLRIDAVGVPASDGKIGMTLCPGRRDALSVDGPWERDLAADIAVVIAWQPALVITLVEEKEFALLGVPDFAAAMESACVAAGVRWVQVSIADAGVPDRAFELAWIDVGAFARAALAAGGRVLLHCRAGLGRTGMIAARLLVELGVPSDDAIRSVRAARPNTIETVAQEKHVRSCSAIRAAGAADVEERFLGSLVGGAIGDALGAAYEFLSSKQIAASIGGSIARDYSIGIGGSLLTGHPAGMPTDDTAMTLALLASLEAAEFPLRMTDIHAVLCRSLQGDYPLATRMFREDGPGGACMDMLRVAKAGAGPFEALNLEAGGNGAAMRAHVCGLFPDRALVAEFAAAQARLSHPYPPAVAAAQTVALIAHDGFYTGTFTTELPPEITEPTMVAAWRAAHRDLVRGEQLPRHLRDVDMAGWNTVSAAHAIALLYADDIETAIGVAAASGRDTDTVASIVGAMLGAVHGYAALPQRWIAGLAHHDELCAWAPRMTQIAWRSTRPSPLPAST